MALSILLVVQLVAIGCSALPRRKLSEHIAHYDVAHYDKQSLHEAHSSFSEKWHKGQTDPFEFTMTITSHGRVFALELHPDEEVFAPGVKFLDGDNKPFDFNHASVLVGRVAGETDSLVHGSILDGRFRGIIQVHGEKYVVDPALAHFQQKQPFHSVMYKDSDVAHDKLMGTWPSHLHAVHANDSQTTEQESSSSSSSGSSQRDRFQEAVYKEVHHRARRQASGDMPRVECQLNMAADHTYSAEVARVEAYQITDLVRIRAAVIQTFAAYVRVANSIFEKTTFSASASKPEGYRVAILSARAYVNEAEMKTFRPGTILSSPLTSAKSVLDDWSKANWNDFCLSYLFVHRDFDNSVLGLAYVATLCSTHNPSQAISSSNTAIVTSLNAGGKLPEMSVALVFVHELGHNYGSDHDKTAECTPSDANGGRYIMSANANNGNQPNHRRFSPCSARTMLAQLAAAAGRRGGKCLSVASGGQVCGNNVKEEGEECDCGVAKHCAASDLCCNGYTTGQTSGMNCKRKSGNPCSVQDGPCCEQASANAACSLTTMASNKTCSESFECRIGVGTCNGTSAVCPRARSKPNGTLCNRGRLTCDRGDCNNTVCAFADLKECFCTGADACAVCCMSGGTCTPLRDISGVNHTGISKNLSPGQPCENYRGHCNFLNFCRRLDDTSLLGTIATSLFNLSTFESAWTWAKGNWYYVLLGFFGIILFFSLIIHFFAKKTPRTVEVHRRTMRNAATAKKGGSGTENLELVGRQ